MNNPMPLFHDGDPYKGMPPSGLSSTSRAAAIFMVGNGWRSLQFRVLKIMGDHPAGMCDWELRPYFKTVSDFSCTIIPRRRELVLKGFITEIDETRVRPETGRPCRVRMINGNGLWVLQNTKEPNENEQ